MHVIVRRKADGTYEVVTGHMQASLVMDLNKTLDAVDSYSGTRLVLEFKHGSWVPVTTREATIGFRDWLDQKMGMSRRLSLEIEAMSRTLAELNTEIAIAVCPYKVGDGIKCAGVEPPLIVEKVSAPAKFSKSNRWEVTMVAPFGVTNGYKVAVQEENTHFKSVPYYSMQLVSRRG